MIAIESTGIKNLSCTEIEKPSIQNPYEVLVKIKFAGVCGSDIHYYKYGRIGDQVIQFPFIMGHECSGIIEAVGSNVSNVQPGDLVAVDPLVSCGNCEQCLSGREHTCLNQNFLGCPGQLKGCLSEYIILPAKNCYTLPVGINAEMGALIEPLSIGYYAVSFIKGNPGKQSAAILGSGPIGLSLALFLKVAGIVNIFMTDKLDYRLAAAKQAGAVWTGNPEIQDVVQIIKSIKPNLFDLVFECCGEQDAIDQAIEIIKPGGKLILVGIPETDRISFDISKIRRKEISIQNVRRQNNSIEPVIHLISKKMIAPEFMITHIFRKEEAAAAFETVSDYKDNVIKALIEF